MLSSWPAAGSPARLDLSSSAAMSSRGTQSTVKPLWQWLVRSVREDQGRQHSSRSNGLEGRRSHGSRVPTNHHPSEITRLPM